MKEAFIDSRFGVDKQAIVDMVNGVVVDYQAQGLRLTLRQLYYQCISHDLFPDSWIDAAYNAKNKLQPTTKNTVKNYKRLGTILSDARQAGLVDWDAIEDRGRRPNTIQEFRDLDHLFDVALGAYRLARWDGQEHYAELWVEKDALSGVLQPLASEFHVTLMVNKGYSSQSAMYEASKRFIAQEQKDKDTLLFYLGDHDPSGEDMVRDVRDRLHLYGSDVTVRKLALTMDQIEQHNPPPNPTKMSDSRADKYVDRHGNESWEVDALPPEALDAIIREEFLRSLDMDLMDEIKAQEEKDKELMRTAVASVRKKKGK